VFSLRKKWKLLDDTLKHFSHDTLLDDAWRSVLKMVEFDSEMFSLAHQTLRKEFSEEIIAELRKKDLSVNDLRNSVRQNILTHLTVSNRYRIDTSFALGMVTIVNGLERIGDNCKNIAELAMINRNTMKYGAMEETITALENTVFKHFEMLKKAFTKEDGRLSMELQMEFRDNIGIPVEKTLAKILQGDFSDLPKSSTVSAALYLRYLKRIDANQKNVASIMTNPFSNLGYKMKESTE